MHQQLSDHSLWQFQQSIQPVKLVANEYYQGLGIAWYDGQYWTDQGSRIHWRHLPYIKTAANGGGSCATFRSAKAPGICAPTSWHLTWSSYQIKPPPGPSQSLDTMLFSHLNHYVDFLNKANYHPSPIPMEFRSILKNCSSGWQRHNSALLT